MALFIFLLILFLAVLHLYHNWSVQSHSLYLSFAMMVIALLFISHYIFLFQVSVFWLAVIFGHVSSLFYLLGPFIFFYVRATLSDRPGLRRKDRWHFLPFAVGLAMDMSYILKPWSVKLRVAGLLVEDIRNLHNIGDMFLTPPWFNVPMRFLSMIGYTAYTLWMLNKFRSGYPKIGRIPLEDARLVLRFMTYLLVVCLFAETSFLTLAIIFFSDTGIGQGQLIGHPLLLISGIGVLSIPILILLYPQVLYGIPRWRKRGEETSAVQGNAKPVEPSVGQTVEETVLAAGSPEASEDRFQELAAQIDQCMTEQQPWLNPDFSLDDLARLMDVPKHHLYYCLNTILKKRFTRLRAEYRIAHACRLIEGGATRSKTLEAIGIESGFANRISFTGTFREITGLSPSDFARKVS